MRELRMHGDATFPVALYDWHGVDEQGMILECHWHDEWEFLAIEEGCTLFTVNGKKRLLKKNDIVFVPGNSMHMAEPYEGKHCRYKAIVFGMQMLYGLSGDIVQVKYIAPLCEHPISADAFIFHEEAGGHVYSVFEKIYAVVTERADAYEILAKGYLYELLACVLRESGGINEHPAGLRELIGATQSIKAAITYMAVNYREHVTVPQLATMTNMSAGHFSKLFKKMTSYSPVEYLLNQRLSKAAAMLVDTNEQVLTIAVDVGFNNIGYFIRSFQKKFGCTPRQYRKIKKDKTVI